MMDQEIMAAIEWGNQRLDLLRELASSLQLAQAAVVRSDLRGVDSQTERQRELCDVLRQLGSAAFLLPESAGGRSRKQNTQAQLAEIGLAPGVGQRWQVLAQDLRQVEMQVDQLNRVYAALLRRAQRTLQ